MQRLNAKYGDVVYVDCETTGLDPDRHVIWEISLIDDDSEYEFLLPLAPDDIANADPVALDIGHFHERHPQGNRTPNDLIVDNRAKVAEAVGEMTHGKHLVGACPWFDAERLTKFLHAYGVKPAWHYHLIDVEALAVGWLMVMSPDSITEMGLPWKSTKLSDLIGIRSPSETERHTALGDARWARRIYERIVLGRMEADAATGG